MNRHLLNIAAITSIGLAVAMGALWIRSLRIHDNLDLNISGFQHSLQSSDGRVDLSRFAILSMSPRMVNGNWQMVMLPPPPRWIYTRAPAINSSPTSADLLLPDPIIINLYQHSFEIAVADWLVILVLLIAPLLRLLWGFGAIGAARELFAADSPSPGQKWVIVAIFAVSAILVSGIGCYALSQCWSIRYQHELLYRQAVFAAGTFALLGWACYSRLRRPAEAAGTGERGSSIEPVTAAPSSVFGYASRISPKARVAFLLVLAQQIAALLLALAISSNDIRAIGSGLLPAWPTAVAAYWLCIVILAMARTQPMTTVDAILANVGFLLIFGAMILTVEIFVQLLF
jgi:hypothetical protein